MPTVSKGLDRIWSLRSFISSVAILPIFKGVLDFAIELDGPDILLETNEDGKGNWLFKESALEEEPAAEHYAEESAGSFALLNHMFVILRSGTLGLPLMTRLLINRYLRLLTPLKFFSTGTTFH